MKNILAMMQRGKLPKSYELRESDIGASLGADFGEVQKQDIGKIVVLKPYGLCMENTEQMQERKKQVVSVEEAVTTNLIRSAFEAGIHAANIGIDYENGETDKTASAAYAERLGFKC